MTRYVIFENFKLLIFIIVVGNKLKTEKCGETGHKLLYNDQFNLFLYQRNRNALSYCIIFFSFAPIRNCFASNINIYTIINIFNFHYFLYFFIKTLFSYL